MCSSYGGEHVAAEFVTVSAKEAFSILDMLMVAVVMETGRWAVQLSMKW